MYVRIVTGGVCSLPTPVNNNKCDGICMYDNEVITILKKIRTGKFHTAKQCS